MSDYTHADLLAAVGKAREGWKSSGSIGTDMALDYSRSDHCDDLEALLRWHAPEEGPTGEPRELRYANGRVSLICSTCAGGGGMNADWPCADVRRAIDRLTAWGAL